MGMRKEITDFYPDAFEDGEWDSTVVHPVKMDANGNCERTTAKKADFYSVYVTREGMEHCAADLPNKRMAVKFQKLIDKISTLIPF